MTAAPFIVSMCASLEARAEDDADDTSVHGISLAPPKQAALRAELGMAAALPTLLLGANAGITDRVDLGAFASTHAGLAYALGATVRARMGTLGPSRWGLGLTIDESFYTVEQLAGIESLRSPFGNRLAVTPQWLVSAPLRSGVRLGGGLGTEVGLLRLERQRESAPPSPAVRAFRPALDTFWAEGVASFPRRNGVLFVRLRAIVPVASDFHVLGYLPHLAVGRAWGTP